MEFWPGVFENKYNESVNVNVNGNNIRRRTIPIRSNRHCENIVNDVEVQRNIGKRTRSPLSSEIVRRSERLAKVARTNYKC